MNISGEQLSNILIDTCCRDSQVLNLSTAIKKYAEEVQDTIDCGNCGTNQLYHVQYSED